LCDAQTMLLVRQRRRRSVGRQPAQPSARVRRHSVPRPRMSCNWLPRRGTTRPYCTDPHTRIVRHGVDIRGRGRETRLRAAACAVQTRRATLRPRRHARHPCPRYTGGMRRARAGTAGRRYWSCATHRAPSSRPMGRAYGQNQAVKRSGFCEVI